ncbi:hypothetical protein GCM10010363_60060 [Streptomyces omiyaensis]|uniref:hypothetical protein n=1 Tax=Streptomyces omiyaensis TaxID=68247 RepID=UPI0016745D65|nr:hypothetical protein [Streptomyces omiyaensis]GGY70939.1 hypothetical protein GCM10010363_60060 [Streptomyces omiyaensis]
MFNAGDIVEFVSCDDDPRAIGKTGKVIDEVPPGPLTDYRWTVGSISIWIAPVLVRSDEIRKVG